MTVPLHTLLNVACRIKVVDIGANPIDGSPPYAPLLEAGHTDVVGFEPNPAALAELLRKRDRTRHTCLMRWATANAIP